MESRAKIYVSECPKPGGDASGIGLSVFSLDAVSGKLLPEQRFPLSAGTNVSALDQERGLLYVLSEEPDPARQRREGDRVLVLRLHRGTGAILETAQEIHTMLPNPVYVTVDRDRQFMMTAIHSTHNAVTKVAREGTGWRSWQEFDDSAVMLYTLNPDGLVGELADVVFHTGSGPLRTQAHAHTHSVVQAPEGDAFAVCDKGADTVTLYLLDRQERRLRPLGKPYRNRPGEEPRFCVFHPNLDLLYVNHEGDLGLDVLRYGRDGLALAQRVSVMPPSGGLRPGAVYEHQGIAMHPSGRFLYSVARGADALAAFSVDREDGTLSLIELKSLEGSHWPRCCGLTPDGKWLIAGAKDTGALWLFRVGEDGALTQTDRVDWDTGVTYMTAAVLGALID